eukprot:5217235-Prymnesium_polylepis.1
MSCSSTRCPDPARCCVGVGPDCHSCTLSRFGAWPLYWPLYSCMVCALWRRGLALGVTRDLSFAWQR